MCVQSSVVFSRLVSVACFFNAHISMMVITQKTKMAAIVDCTSFAFQVAGILDSILYNTIKLMKKVELGKNF